MPSLLHLFSIVFTEVRKIAAASSSVAEVAAIRLSCRSSFNENGPLRFFAISFLGLGELHCIDRSAKASTAIKPAINSNEIVAAIAFAVGLSFHDRRP